MTQMFGTDIWLESLTAVRRNLLTGTQFRSELTNLMRWRFERDLGYMTTLDFQVINTSGRGIFDMIFATNHWAGEKITTELYSKAMERAPSLRKKALLQRRQAKLEDAGIHGLFDMTDVAPPPEPANPVSRSCPGRRRPGRYTAYPADPPLVSPWRPPPGLPHPGRFTG
jgi:hypothetical protein